MNSDAVGMFGLALSLFGLGFVVLVAGRIWLRAKQLERDETPTIPADSAADIVSMLSKLDGRIGRLEQSVEATAIEVERIAEAQRFSARLLAGGRSAAVDEH
jgi:hypothetical protein